MAAKWPIAPSSVAPVVSAGWPSGPLTTLPSAARLIAERGMKGLEDVQPEFDGMLKIFRERQIELAEGFVLLGHARHL